MNRNSIFIIYLAALLPLISIIYYYSLVVALPVGITSGIVILLCLLLLRYAKKNLDVVQPLPQPVLITILSYSVLAVALFLMVKNTYPLAAKYGEWDAWWFWNYRAKYLADPASWNFRYIDYEHKDLVQQPIAHADYPPGLSAAVAFFWRLLQTRSTAVPFGISFFFAIGIPVLLFVEFQRKNLLIAALLLWWFAGDQYYLVHGCAMLADIWIAFFLLAAMVGLGSYERLQDSRSLLLCGMCFGACLWTKNEALFLLLVFVVCYSRILLRKKNFLYFLAGLAGPFLALVVFKLAYAPPGDLFTGGYKVFWQKGTDPSRYMIIWQYFIQEINTHYYYLKLVFLLYLLQRVLLRTWSSMGIVYILICMAGYFVIYAISPHNIDWHVLTSLDRIVLQLLPSFVYILVADFTALNRAQQKYITVLPK